MVIALILIVAVLLPILANHPTQSPSQLALNSTSTVSASAPTATPIPTVTPTPTPSPTPSPTPPPPTQYVSNWTQGNDGWSGTQDWQVYGGMLHNSGQNNHNGDTPTITAPFQPNQDDYAVEAVFMVPSPYYNYCFGITVRGDTTGNGSTFGYSVNISCDGSYLSITADDGSNGNHIFQAPFDPGTDWHTIRIEVKLNNAKVYIDGGLKADVQDNSHPTGHIIGLWSDRLALNIKSFKVAPL